MKKTLLLGLILILMVSLVAVGCGQKQEAPPKEEPKKEEAKKEEAPKAWKPEKPIEFVVPYSAGGGSDTFARTMVDIIQKKNLVEQPIMVVNKPGGSGAVGMNYVYAKKGDKHTIMTFVTGQVASPLANKAEITLEDVTPIANMVLDEYLLAVRADSGYKTFEDLVKAVKANPNTISVGGSGTGNEDHMCYGLVNQKIMDNGLKYVAFNGSGEVMTALLGGHLEAGIFNPNEALGQIEAGEVIPLATWSTNKLSGLEDMPTFIDLGYKDVVFQQFRAVAGPPEMPAEVIEFWEGVFKQVAESDEFKERYWSKNLQTLKFLTSAEAKKFYQNEEKKYIELLTGLGLMK